MMAAMPNRACSKLLTSDDIEQHQQHKPQGDDSNHHDHNNRKERDHNDNANTREIYTTSNHNNEWECGV